MAWVLLEKLIYRLHDIITATDSSVQARIGITANNNDPANIKT